MVTLGDAMRGRAIDPKLQSKQFGFKISGFPEGNPHLNRETQKEAGILGRENFDPDDPDTEMPLNQHGDVVNIEGSSAVLQRRPGRPSWQKPDPQQRLFDIEDVPTAKPHEQTPDQWLRRDDVMFHTGPQPGEKFHTGESERPTHFGTAEAGMTLYGSSQARDVVARRIPGVHELPTAVDTGASHWDIEDVQYENKVEDMGSVSAHVHPENTRSWVDDQQNTGGQGRGRFSDYAHQLEQKAMYDQKEFPPDTSFRFRSQETNRASLARRGQTLKPPPSHHQDFLADEESLQWGPRPTEWRFQWDKMKNWKMKP